MNKKEIEKSIIKTYRKEIWRKFTTAINEYKLIEEGDKIAVCISGGKDSFLLAKCLEEIKRHGKINFDLEFISMDPGYSLDSTKLIEENASKLGIDLKVFKTDIFNIVSSITDGAPCYLCARMRRGYLYDYAKKIGCNKIALGHHFDDVIETTLMSMFYNGKFETMLPKIDSKNFEGVKLIRPLYLVKEKDIINWVNYNDLNFIGCACNLKEESSKRKEIKDLITELRKNSKFIDKNIFNSANNINLDQILGYYKNGEYNSIYED